MMRTMLKSKIHRATVTQADLHYVGSVTIDEDLLDAADLLPGEQVAIVDVTNGARLETYVIPGERGSGVIGINGAAAHLVHPGDLVILISYGVMDETEAKSYLPRVVHVDGANRIVELGGDPAAPSPGVLGPACAATSIASLSRAARRRHRQQPDRPRHLRRRQAGRLLAGHHRAAGHRRRAAVPLARAAARHRDHRRRRLLDRAGAAARRCAQLLDSLEVPVVLIGPGRAHRRPAARGQPPRGRLGPRRHRAGRARVLRHAPRRPRPAGRRRRLRHLHQRRRRRPGRAVPRRRARARRRGQPGRAGRPGRRSCARSSSPCPQHAIGKNTVAALQSGLVLGFAGLVDGLVGPDRRRARRPSSGPRRSSSPPAGCPRWWSTAAARSPSGSRT